MFGRAEIDRPNNDSYQDRPAGKHMPARKRPFGEDMNDHHHP
jgi:hypothetical protein